MSNHSIKKAISAVLALGMTSISIANEGQTINQSGAEMLKGPVIPGMERCFGVVKAGMNDCGNTNHHCSGEAKLARDKQEWVYMPTGLCHRIDGGKTNNDQ
jgi:uncharacterized membrane protein